MQLSRFAPLVCLHMIFPVQPELDRPLIRVSCIRYCSNEFPIPLPCAWAEMRVAVVLIRQHYSGRKQDIPARQILNYLTANQNRSLSYIFSYSVIHLS
ncbi:hypothetical protein GGR52DRAFT_537095 [Hypoxylon sp. FL1284]|nr:hypothetical protein GGR52DRAFT_537095 [Hypoxylon sp. FL1284]